jgi:nucleoside-diphosphate-sugar epimerase
MPSSPFSSSSSSYYYYYITGASLWKELQSRGHSVTLFNRGKTPPKPLPRETPQDFQQRVDLTTFIQGDRQKVDVLPQLIDPTLYDYVYDMNAREESDTRPLAQLFASSARLQQYVFMSSAGVYLKSDELPHLERDAVDPKSRHKGKLDSEQCLQSLQLPWCSFRPTYICGPQNYNPVERYFFERLDAHRPICIPGHGQHLTGLGHVHDLAVAMANVIGRTDRTTGKVYNVQNTQAITFDGVAKAAAKVMGKKDVDAVEIIHYNPKDYSFPEGAKVNNKNHKFLGLVSF